MSDHMCQGALQGFSDPLRVSLNCYLHDDTFYLYSGLWTWRENSGPLLFPDSHFPSLPEFISAFLSN